METISFSPDRLREARKATGMTEREAAEAVGVTRETLRNAENGVYTPRGDTLAKLAQRYGVTIDSLFIVHAQDATAPTKGRGRDDAENDQARALAAKR